MQPSYVYCKICGFVLPDKYFPFDVQFPTDDEELFQKALAYARKNVKCPYCGNKKWIRKAYYKVI